MELMDIRRRVIHWHCQLADPAADLYGYSYEHNFVIMAY